MIMTKKITMSQVLVRKRAKRASNDALLVALRQMLSAISSELLLQHPRHGTAAFTDCETQTVVHRDRVIRVTTILMLSPGITISTPSGVRWYQSRQ